MDSRTRRFIEEQLLTTRELSRLSGIPEITLQKRVERGLLDCVKKGRTYLFDRRDVPALLRSAGKEADTLPPPVEHDR